MTPAPVVELVYRHGGEIVTLFLICGAMLVALFGIAGVFDAPKKKK